ncbi:SGNH/GDSL hydrolase family protein [Neobacillus vireti]|uniref:SGNH/GDSL hydrolase family protein n=1 Tax=Neobacillus vireti LMG 21834 TaxID=1131730 RepID=A0AB94IQ59_9BACI|nr:SGNH/GDSL hydrolase family protein [Neobacillus vireti]ETI69174.1 hypothetical protein BAVI_08746 [Neobacillus vireti LMG 21834]KLT15551.1 hypothetical protein AA980_23190 [Neobacillus vireti]
MAKFLTALLGIVFLVVLYLGQSHWNQQMTASAKSKPSSGLYQASTTKTDKLNLEEKGIEKDLLRLTRNWPSDSVNRFKETLKAEKTFKILFVGSPAIGSETAGPFPLVKEHLLETFGENYIQVAVKTFDSTTTQFINNHHQAEIAAEHADLIVLEPFILLNNGKVLLDKTIKDITTIIDDVSAKNPGTSFILQPSYPLYKAKIYPQQVAGLKKFAEEQGLPYLNHWDAWPDPNSDAIKDNLLPDQSAPSEKGNKIWSGSISQFLISESESE